MAAPPSPRSASPTAAIPAVPQPAPTSTHTDDAKEPTTAAEEPTPHQDTSMPDAAEPQSLSHAQIPKSAAFTDALMHRVLSPSPPPRKPRALDPAPDIQLASLPLALDSPLRTHTSPMAGVYLTHAGGWIEGGAPPPATVDIFSDAFIAELFPGGRAKTSTAQLKRRIKEEMGRARDELVERMRDRKDALEGNERIDEEIARLEGEREMERRVEEKMRAGRVR